MSARSGLGKKILPAPFGAIWAHFLRWPEKSKKCRNFAYFPWWAHGPYSPGFRDVPCRAVPRSGGSVPCQIFPCRALMIRAQIWLPEIWGPFLWKKSACGTVPTSQGLPNIWGPFCWKQKSACGNVPTSQGLPNIWGPFCWKKKAPAETYPQVKGFQKFGPLGIQAEKQGFRTAWLITGQKFP